MEHKVQEPPTKVRPGEVMASDLCKWQVARTPFFQFHSFSQFFLPVLCAEVIDLFSLLNHLPIHQIQTPQSDKHEPPAQQSHGIPTIDFVPFAFLIAIPIPFMA